MKSISIEELHDHFKSLSEDELILDVRTPKEYSEGHVPGAKNIPFDQVGNHVGELKKFKTLYIYCKAGGRVQAAAEILGSMGVNQLALVDDGGFPDWEDAGFERE